MRGTQCSRKKILLNILRVCSHGCFSSRKYAKFGVFVHLGHWQWSWASVGWCTTNSTAFKYQSSIKQCAQFVGIFLINSQARTTVKKNTYEPMWNEQIVFSELVIFLFYSCLLLCMLMACLAWQIVLRFSRVDSVTSYWPFTILPVKCCKNF